MLFVKDESYLHSTGKAATLSVGSGFCHHRATFICLDKFCSSKKKTWAETSPMSIQSNEYTM